MASAATPASLAETSSATLFVALELSRSTWLVALHSPITNKVSQPRLDGGDADGLLAVCRACSTAWRWKSSTQPDGGEGLARISHTFCDTGAVRSEKVSRCKSLTATGQADPFRQSVFQPSAGRLMDIG